MKLKKVTAILLCVLLVISMLPTAYAAPKANGYYNVNFLEDYAARAYDVQGLGASYSPSATTWKVWSPNASHVQVRLYATGSDSEEGAAVLGAHSMTRDPITGVWSLKLNGDYKNVYYTYLVSVRGVTRETRDIYAKAAGVNGDRSMVVDLDATDPAGWEDDAHVLQADSTDAVIWEVHVRDFSISATSGVSEENRGKYLAFTEEATTLNGTPGEVSTCVSYLKEMGVNTVHLLPVYDFGSVDESDPKAWIETTMEQALSEGYNGDGTLNENYYRPERNWGYDPNNYNVPEGSYSSDPYDGNTRITEFKQMVQALHEAGISVVMDVVYNHTYDLDDLTWGRVLHNNAFNDTVPGYYFRLSSPLSWINGSGCGNVTASDKLMYRKYMVESVHYWAEEYHIDGFRFDLMACHDVETMNAIRADLDQLDGGEGKKILMYGEPWDGSFGGGTGIADGATADNANYLGLSERIALFCPWMRDGIKGDPDGSSWGWIQGDTTQAGTIYGGLTANDGRLSARSQTVTYADAHDNLILWDKILISNGSTDYSNYSSDSAQKYLKQLNLAKTIVLMSQGMAFNVAGTEFARTKLGCHNSYKAGDNINAIDWTARKTNAASADYYKGLIAIRKAFSPITDPKNEYAKYSLEGNSNSCIAIRVPNTAANIAAGEWANLILILNDSEGAASVTLPEGEWTVIANGVRADPNGLGTATGNYMVNGFGSAILVNRTALEAPIPEPDSDYYLVGWINGGAVGCENDESNKGPYQFVEGSLTVTFQEDSYVFVKTGDNSKKYMSKTFVETETTATLYNTANETATEKMKVPGGVELVFTLVEAGNDTLTLSYTVNGDLPEPDQNFYLQGWINGAQYNGKDYVFTEGSLTTQFTADSYVMIKWGDTEYWTEGYPGNEATGAFFYKKADCTTPDKLRVPGNTPVTFTLTVLTGGILNLTYTTPSKDLRSLGRSFDGEEWLYVNALAETWWDDFSPAHLLILTGTDSSTTTVPLSWVASVSETERVFGAAIPAGSYTSLVIARADPTDQSNIYNQTGAIAIPETGNYVSAFSQNSTEATWSEYVPGSAPVGSEAKDAVILHCWNWSYDTIRQQLAAIKAAGYTAVQTSPAQPHSGYHTGEVPTGDWWMLYQPLGLHIAQEGESWLGDAEDLSALCEAAHALGIEVIVDVVANHICNGYNDVVAEGVPNPYDDSEIIATGLDWTGTNTIYGYRFETLPDQRAKNFNPELFPEGESLTKYFRDYIFVNDNSTEAVVRGNIGMPDFKTEEPVVQQSVLNYLKELIDAGVDGFRFDAAKHIETPSDGDYASDFWPTIINGAKEYASEKDGSSIWAYGEVLSTAGKDRKMNYYAPYIDMTEISYAYTITESFGTPNDGSASTIANQQFKDWLGVGVEPLANSSLVLMAESHDMYAESGNSFSRFGSEVINKAWAVAVARADASALYFARPLGYSREHYEWEEDQTSGYPIGTLGACEDFHWQDTEVAEANKFHTAFAGSPEDIYAAGNLVVVERYNANDQGAVIANATGYAGYASFQSRHLADGDYYDQITGSQFTVSGGRVSGQIGTTGIAVLRKQAPVVCDHPAESRYTVTKEATCTEDGYEAIYCALCGRQVELVSILPALGHIDLDGDNYCDRCGSFLGTLRVYFVDSEDWVNEKDHFSNVNVYAWGEGGQNAAWPGLAAELVGRTTDNHGIWCAELDPELYQSVKFIGNPGGSDETKTANLAFGEDAAGLNSDFVVYQPDGSTVNSDNGIEYGCAASADLEAICAHTAYRIIPVGNGEYKRCDCCGKEYDNNDPDNPFKDVKKKNYFYAPVMWAFYHQPQVTSGTDATHFSPNKVCTREQVVTFLWAVNGKPEPTGSSNPFQDVKKKDYFYKAVLWAVENGVTSGVSETKFGVGQSCTREQVVTFLWAANGKPAPTISQCPFKDVKPKYWFYSAVLWAVEHKITSGVSKTKFGVGENCTRGQVVTFLYAAYPHD